MWFDWRSVHPHAHSSAKEDHLDCFKENQAFSCSRPILPGLFDGKSFSHALSLLFFFLILIKISKCFSVFKTFFL